ncbi:MAG: phasin family protein [Fluviibacter sp.]
MTKANVLNVEQIAAANTAAVANLQTVANTALQAIESLSALNLSFVRDSLDKGSQQVNAAMKAKTPQEAAALTAESVQPTVENIVAYTRSLYDIANGAASIITEMLKKQFDDLSKQVQEAAVTGAKAAPFGSDVALAAIKQAIDANNTAYANLNKAVKQAADLAESNVAQATTAAVKAVKRK